MEIKSFGEFMVEGKVPSVASVKAVINKADLKILDPQFFRIEKKNNDAGMGGEDYIAVFFNSAPRAKDEDDINTVMSDLAKAFGNTMRYEKVIVISAEKIKRESLPYEV